MTNDEPFSSPIDEMNFQIQALQVQTDMFSLLLNSINALIYVADMKTFEIIFINTYGRNLWGDKTGKKCWQVLQKDQQAPCKFCTNSELIGLDGNPTEGVTWEFQNTVNNRWYDCRDRAIRWPDGRLVRMEIATDITDRKLMEERLKDSEEKYRSAADLIRLMCDNVPDMIWAKDLDNRYIFANRATCRHLLNATDIEEPIGKTDIFFAERERQRYPDNPKWHTFGEICRDTDAITIAAGKPQQFDEHGNVQGNFLFLDVHKAPLWSRNGKMIGTVGSARNVTITKEMETSLKNSEARLREVL